MWLLLVVAAASQPPRRLSLARGDPPPHASFSWPSNGAAGWPSAAVPGVMPDVEPLAPNEVTDVCGGYPGHTKLNEVGQDCAAWTVETLRCMQVCHNTNRLQGFGQCMTDCGVYNPATPPLNEDPPEEGWPTPEEAQNAFCSVGVVNVNVSNVCLHAVKKLQKCNCTLPESTPMPEDYMNCLNTCVFECNKALSLQLRLGTPIGWKPRKCPRDIFGCTANQTCTKLPPCGPFDTEGCVEMECRPPVGRGRVDCVGDDPICGADNTTVMCLLPPPPVINETNVTLPPTAADLRAAAAQAVLDARADAANPPPDPPPDPPQSLLRHRRVPATVGVEHIAKKISSAMRSGVPRHENQRAIKRAKDRWLRRVSGRH